MSSSRTEPRRPWLRWSIRTRLTALFVAIFGVTLVVFSVLLYSAFVRNHEAEFDADLFNHAIDVAQGVDVDMFGDLEVRSDLFSTGGKILPFATGKSFIQILRPDGRVLARSRALESLQLPLDPDDRKLLSRRGVAFRTIQAGSISAALAGQTSEYRLVDYMARQGGQPKFILQIAVPMTLLEQERKGLRTFFLFSIPFTLIVATLGGLFLSRRALAPVSDIIARTRGIGATNLSERLPVPPADDEVRRLSLTLNGLLDRLEQAFDVHQRFVADASHQLKTPLAILRGELDLVRSRPRSPEELREFIDSASQELEHLSRMVEDLLLLARVDAGAGSLTISPTRVDEVALEAVARLEPLARTRGVRIHFDLAGTDFEVRGDGDLLQSMLRNLLENAIKYTSENTMIDVLVEDAGDDVRIAVRDRGPGIPAGELSRVFERFYRYAPGGSAAGGADARLKTPGFGLGLTIARRIAEAHRGAIEAESEVGSGTTFRVRVKKV
jgi:heavy metal sensor kinase